MELNEISEKIIGSVIKVHRALGVGLLESTYEICLIHELRKSVLSVQSPLALPVIYDGIKIDAGYRIDLPVEDQNTERLIPIHEAQLFNLF